MRASLGDKHSRPSTPGSNGRRASVKTNKTCHKRYRQLEACSPGCILFLAESLVDSNTADLQTRVNKFLQEETKSTLVFQILLLSPSDEAVVYAIGEKRLDKQMRFPIANRMVQSALNSDMSVTNAQDNLDQQLVTVLQYVIPNACEVLTVPVQNNKGVITLLVCMLNYPKNQERFCHKVITETFRFCLTMIVNTAAAEEERRLKDQCQSLLVVAKRIFSKLGNLNDLLKGIIIEARKLTNAERCALFLMDSDGKELVAKVFEGAQGGEVHIPKGKGVAGHVAATGQLLNIRDAYSHPLFFKGIDDATGYRTRNILCFPIVDDKSVIGVAELCNKLDGLYFDAADEEVAMAFSVYCGISIMHSLVYKKIQDAHARNELANELMIYHMKVNNQDVIRVACCPNKHSLIDVSRFSYSPRTTQPRETTCYVVQMFDDMRLFTRFAIKRETFIRFVLFVERGYRDTPYHNWTHAFSVTHFSFLCIKNFKLIKNKLITELEAMAYYISCLCHDLDHRGTTNAFQMKTGTVLASLYSSEGSVMERHHLSQAICIINTEGCNFLESLSKEEYAKCLDLIKDMILATDLAAHFRLLKEQQAIVKEGYKPTNKEHKTAFLSLLMTAADLSDQTKSWEVVLRVAKLIYNEFFQQGDLEKAMGNKPIEMMDREKAAIPELQIQFLRDVCVPIFTLLVKMFPKHHELLTNVKKNIERWELSKPIFEKYATRMGTSIEVLESREFSKDVQDIFDAFGNL